MIHWNGDRLNIGTKVLIMLILGRISKVSALPYSEKTLCGTYNMSMKHFRDLLFTTIGDIENLWYQLLERGRIELLNMQTEV